MRSGVAVLLLPLGLIVSWSACVRSAPPPPPAPTPPPIRIPAGCERDLAGSYVHALNDTFRYDATDDGSTVVFRVLRGASEGPPTADGGTEPAAQEIVLTRSPDGFRGVTQATAFRPGGKPCPVEFPTEVTACPPDGLVLRSAEEISVHALSCERATSEPRPAMVEQRLIKVPASEQAPDTGDAGTPPAGGVDAGR